MSHNKGKKLVTRWTIHGKVRRYERVDTSFSLTPIIALLITMLGGVTFSTKRNSNHINPYVGHSFIEDVQATTTATVSGALEAEAGQQESSVQEKTEKQKIIDYIVEVFEEDAPDAFSILYCENRNLNPYAENWNRNGTWDAGVFQVNQVHGHSIEDMKDYKKNIDYAHKIFKSQGWTPWSCSERVGIKPFYK